MLQFKVTVRGFLFILYWVIEKVYDVVKFTLFLFFENKRRPRIRAALIVQMKTNAVALIRVVTVNDN